MNYKGITTRVVSVEPGRVVGVHPNKNVSVETQPLSMVDGIDLDRNCVVVSLESGPGQSTTDHAFNLDESEDLLLGLIAGLSAVGNPLALMIADRFPSSYDEIPEEYRSHLEGG
jgi:hypothetical protein